jgi:hypothetical protein
MIVSEVPEIIRQNKVPTYFIAARTHGGFSSQPSPKLLRIPRTVKNRQDGECFVFNGEVNVVPRKPSQSNLSSLTTDLWKLFRIGLRAVQRVLDLSGKLTPQTWPLFFIPNNGLNKFETCWRFENAQPVHFQPNRLLRSALTCSQGIPACGLASKSARRRSSSAACSGVRSGSYPSSTMISQKSCASLILSSFGRAFAASRISVALMQGTLAEPPTSGKFAAQL